MASTISVSTLPSVNPDPATGKAHHIGSPPKSFKNPWPSFRDHSKLDIFRLRFGNSPEHNFVPVPQGLNGTRSEELVKVLEPTWGSDQPDKLRTTWIGHASFLVELPTRGKAARGLRVLFDPVFSERTSPFSWLGPKRYSPTPCALDELPDVDLVVISHNHYDHLDIETIIPLYKRLRGRVHFFVSLGVKAWFLDHIQCSDDEVTELDWWESRQVEVKDYDSVKLTCCPAQHVSGRTIWDSCKTLWCSWALETPAGQRLYFAGDTGYQFLSTPSPCPVFSQIGDHLGPFDLALLPIGLYSPPKVLSAVHVHPEQTTELHKALKSKLSIGMHYGTVRGGLSALFEDVRDPPRRWREAAMKEDMWCGGGVEGEGTMIDVKKQGCGLCHIGETVAV